MQEINITSYNESFSISLEQQSLNIHLYYDDDYKSWYITILNMDTQTTLLTSKRLMANIPVFNVLKTGFIGDFIVISDNKLISDSFLNKTAKLYYLNPANL